MISVAMVSYFSAPALCVSGLMTHDCEGHTDSSCSCDETCDHGSDCRHEGECPDDPCSIGVARVERQNDRIEAVCQALLPTAVTAIVIVKPPDVVMVDRAPHSLDMLPFFFGDLPLLI
ncbi:MAG: hypothetical protein GXP29_14020 [Planctomycetes bacterium]|nr:hypothetical protein [Planctomycetota bacterium]